MEIGHRTNSDFGALVFLGFVLLEMFSGTHLHTCIAKRTIPLKTISHAYPSLINLLTFTILNPAMNSEADLMTVSPLQALSGEMGPFLCSGSHQAQRDCQPSALNCFVEAMSQCVPPIPIRPCVLKYLGKTHNLWLRSTLMLEQQAFEKGLSLHIKPKQSTEFYEQESITPPQQVQWESLIPEVLFFLLGFNDVELEIIHLEPDCPLFLSTGA